MNTINNERTMRKSKAQICSALMKLLQTKPYRRITVSQVCDSAGVSRPTFYKNFDSMDAVVRFKLLQLKKNITGAILALIKSINTSQILHLCQKQSGN